MNFKRTVSLFTAMSVIITALFLSPVYAVGETSEPSESAVFTTESVSPTEASFETETVSETETTEPETTEPETTEPAETVPTEPEVYAKLTVKGKTVKYNNKYALKYVNAYRGEKGVKALKNDKALTKTAYKRSAMLAVNYSRKQPVKTKLKMPKKFIIAKGTYANLVKKYKASGYKKDDTVNSCGIANLKVGGVTFWVMLLDYKEKTEITKVTDYSKSEKSYSSENEYNSSYLKGRKGLGAFKNKTVRYKKNKKYAGQLNLENYNEDINSYFKLSNLKKHTPVEYSTKNDDVAEVSPYGNVTAKDYSAFKERGRYTPKKGDFILFHWYKNDGYLANHVGVVYKVTSTSVVTIEGNTGANDYRNSIVSKRTYRNYKRNSQIVGFVDISKYITRKKAESLANLAKKQLGKKGSNYYYHTKAWKDVIGSYEAANWCAIFCGWLLEQKGMDPVELGRWSPSCTMWIKQCHARATAKVKAKINGTDESYSYKVTFKV